MRENNKCNNALIHIILKKIVGVLSIKKIWRNIKIGLQIFAEDLKPGYTSCGENMEEKYCSSLYDKRGANKY